MAHGLNGVPGHSVLCGVMRPRKEPGTAQSLCTEDSIVQATGLNQERVQVSQKESNKLSGKSRNLSSTVHVFCFVYLQNRFCVRSSRIEPPTSGCLIHFAGCSTTRGLN